MLRFAYAVLTYLMTPFVLGHLLWRSRVNPEYRQRIGERCGFTGFQNTSPAVWLHAVSVGEVQAAAALIRALQRRYPEIPLVVTTMTPTGSAQVRQLFGDSVAHCYVPYDLASSVRRFFRRARPALVIIMETELWPNLFNECGKRRVPLVMASARVSEKSVRRYRLVLDLFKETLSHGVVIAAQSQDDASRFRALGANPRRVHVTGNIKFDFELDESIAERGRALREQQARGRPVWIAASTHDVEEDIVLTAHRRVLEGYPDALLLLVPRHPERFEAVVALVERRGFSCVRRSRADVASTNTQVFVGDTMGELTTFYAASDVAFVGGSLVAIGGHNLLEPAALGVPVLTGPHNFNAADVAALLIENDSATMISNGDALAAQVCGLFADSQERARRRAAGLQVLRDNRGTLQRLMELIEPLVASGL